MPPTHHHAHGAVVEMTVIDIEFADQLSLAASVTRMPKCSSIPEWAGVEVIAEHQFVAETADDLTANVNRHRVVDGRWGGRAD